MQIRQNKSRQVRQSIGSLASFVAGSYCFPFSTSIIYGSHQISGNAELCQRTFGHGFHGQTQMFTDFFGSLRVFPSNPRNPCTQEASRLSFLPLGFPTNLRRALFICIRWRALDMLSILFVYGSEKLRSGAESGYAVIRGFLSSSSGILRGGGTSHHAFEAWAPGIKCTAHFRGGGLTAANRKGSHGASENRVAGNAWILCDFGVGGQAFNSSSHCF